MKRSPTRHADRRRRRRARAELRPLKIGRRDADFAAFVASLNRTIAALYRPPRPARDFAELQLVGRLLHGRFLESEQADKRADEHGRR